MSHGHLTDMLEFLTSSYVRDDIRNTRHSLPMDTNIGRLFSTLAWSLEIIHESADRMVLWDDLDNARGAVLDRYGQNFGVERGGATDSFYRLLIKIKMIALLSGGDIDTIIRAAASLFNVAPSAIELREVFPAKVWLYVDEDLLDAERMEAAPLIAELMKRITAAGVGTRVFLRTARYNPARIYLGIAAGEQIGIKARVRQNTTRTGTASLYVAAAAWEYVNVTAQQRR